MKNIIFYILIFLFIVAGTIIMAYNRKDQKDKADEAWRNVSSLYNPQNAYFDKYIPDDFYAQISAGDFSRDIFPKFSDRKAWAKAAESKYAAVLIKEADKVLKSDVPQMLFSDYRRYAVEGNRNKFEQLYFAKRRELSYLALALCITEDKEKYMPRLLDYVMSVLEEFSWTLPAHTGWDKKKLLDMSRTDLFCAETGAMMALLYHILGEELDKEIENLSEKIKVMTLKRTVYNVMYNPKSVRIHDWYFTLPPNNWLPWCSYNMLVSAVLLENDDERLALYIRHFLRSSARFAANYSDDGFCDEGANYCNDAGMMLFNILHLMHKIRPGSMDKILALPKIRAIFEFIAQVRIGDEHQLTYGDACPAYTPCIERAAICGELIKSDLLKEVGGAKIARTGKCGNHLDTGLKLLFDMPELNSNAEKKDALFTYFKDRLAIVRSEKFSAAEKAGHNAESHNHNDLGHFTLYYNGKPLIVDAGMEKYTAVTFSAKRYTLWYTRGSGHNSPVLGGIEQLAGKDYTAKFIKADKNGFICDLSKAYPAEAGVKSFIRTLDFKPSEVVVEDKFELEKPLDAVITLLTPCDVEIIDGKVRAGNVLIETENIEFFEQKQMPELFCDTSIWGKPLNAIRFKSNRNNYKFIFKEIKK